MQEITAEVIEQLKPQEIDSSTYSGQKRKIKKRLKLSFALGALTVFLLLDILFLNYITFESEKEVKNTIFSFINGTRHLFSIINNGQEKGNKTY